MENCGKLSTVKFSFRKGWYLTVLFALSFPFFQRNDRLEVSSGENIWLRSIVLIYHKFFRTEMCAGTFNIDFTDHYQKLLILTCMTRTSNKKELPKSSTKQFLRNNGTLIRRIQIRKRELINR